MPYIKETDRSALSDNIAGIVRYLKAKPIGDVAGLLNYVITKIIISLFAHNRCYNMGNSIIGALQCASNEFTRRHLNPYEDEKIAENGDIFPIGVPSPPKQPPQFTFVSDYLSWLKRIVPEIGPSGVVYVNDAPNAGQNWTTANDTYLRNAVGGGVDIDNIARSMGRTTNSVIYRIVRFDLKYGGGR